MQTVTLRLEAVAGRCGDHDATRWRAILLFDNAESGHDWARREVSDATNCAPPQHMRDSCLSSLRNKLPAPTTTVGLPGYTAHGNMDTSSNSGGLYSCFLSLPTELRCQIYDCLLEESQSITVSAGYITVFGNRIEDRARKIDIPGLPLELTPLVRPTRDASLLSFAKPPEVAIDNAWMQQVEQSHESLGMPAVLALLLSCHMVNDELTDYMRGKKQAMKITQTQSGASGAEEADPIEQEGLSLYVSYPYGILVLKSMYPYLLKQARRIYISGYYLEPIEPAPASPASSDESESERLTPNNSFQVAPSFSASQRPSLRRSCRRIAPYKTAEQRASESNATQSRPRPRLRLDPPHSRHNRQRSHNLAFPPLEHATGTFAGTAIVALVRTILSPTPSLCTKLSTRFLYPSDKASHAVWSDSNSPVGHILHNVCGGDIGMKIRRCNLGIGLSMIVRPNAQARRVTTYWDNWVVAQMPGTARRYQPDVRHLDAYLVEEHEDHF
jgi:hypothetical protein